ncbi:hypothetical protein HanXRQr2_Chr17g0788421 [Helianthus annuus]|uniref:Uncharacterized protein n=1 Tax=Helianthus annuus TaxID=4232 RepID=A0A9K3DHK4_HELAN|nr:hypothetical protein HanXRQr2_Chr17g0788421 [Helianthus annuus]KAJ0592396.1 hypothetical protein HanHA300_Chr03g0084631 [Helianthus annuus]KAJ0607383.1 hypothetical protein HanHA89_Chr03g0096141 [Helianthus annuus]KAJ0767438.1 hypothetical protein HanLR1_Chr03g0089401 [Helianthus annuus]KAJ0773274.1 hypothetical protein HanOQP8_Chr03g0097381 [Helianthus annuus]
MLLLCSASFVGALEFILAKKGALGTVWIATHLDSCIIGGHSMLEDANIKDMKDVECLIRPPVKDNNSPPTQKSN